MPKISARTLEEHRAATNDKLLDAFGELIMTKGYDGVSLADVAQQAGLARTAIYNYFPDRETLLCAWTDREVASQLHVLTESLAGAENCGEKLRRWVRMQFDAFTTQHLPPGQEVFQMISPEAYQRLRAHIEPLERTLHAIIQEGGATGEFAQADPETSVPLVMACIGSERLPLATKQHDIDEATDRVTAFLLRALGAG